MAALQQSMHNNIDDWSDAVNIQDMDDIHQMAFGQGNITSNYSQPTVQSR